MGYSETMAENGRKGGLAKGRKFQPLAREALRLFITHEKLQHRASHIPNKVHSIGKLNTL
jgi:hypothetical protein